MKKILFYLECTQPGKSGKRHGGGRYGEIVFKRIVEKKFPIIAYYNSSKWLNPEIRQLIESNNIPLYDSLKETLEKVIIQNHIDRIYYPMEVYGKLANLKCCEIYGTIHGLRAMELQFDSFMLRYKKINIKEKIIFILKKYLPSIGYRHARKYFQNILSNNNYHFAMVSHHSCAMMKAFFPESKDKVIPCFYSPSTSANVILSKKYTEKFFLMVSANRWEKNVLRGIIAFDRLFSMGYLQDFSVKITGVENLNNFLYKMKNKSRFKFYGYVDDLELEQLYHDTYAFVYPTLNEGFGYPPLEAMHYGIPVLTSSHTSIPEICGDAVLYFNPYSIEEIMARILFICNKEHHIEYSNRAKERFEKITKMQRIDLDNLINFIYGTAL